MKNYVFPPPSQIVLPIKGRKEYFPVRRIYCIGRNYAEHALEMGHNPEKEPPFFFQKNRENVNISGEFPYPLWTKEVHFEMELVVALISGGSDIPEIEALNHVFGYGLGLDMTRRDLQAEAKKLGRPWEIGKAFEKSAPMSELTPRTLCGDFESGKITLKINTVTKQEGNLNQMIWKIPEMISYLSRFYDIAAGDLIMTGTPSGVGPVRRGDEMVGAIEGLGSFQFKVT